MRHTDDRVFSDRLRQIRVLVAQKAVIVNRFCHEIWIPLLIIAAIFGTYYIALRLDFVPEGLIGWVIVGCVMIVGLAIYSVRAILLGDSSWDRAIELAWGIAIGAFFLIGIPFGACMLLSAVLARKEKPLECLIFGLLGGICIAVYFFWIEPWLSRRPKRVKAPCPKCSQKSLRLIRDASSVATAYKCSCGWEGSFAEVWPDALKEISPQ
jgi:predicted RNA-binding Zn-ribbon protein involved in translation (DUF1610 family)